MKTWEMIKEISENKEKKFKNSMGNIVGLNKTGRLSWLEKGNNNGDPLVFGSCDAWPNLNIEWELVREPVDFMTAVKAFSEGKPVICESSSFGKRRYNPTHGHTLIDDKDSSISYQEIINGKWYIED